MRSRPSGKLFVMLRTSITTRRSRSCTGTVVPLSSIVLISSITFLYLLLSIRLRICAFRFSLPREKAKKKTVSPPCRCLHFIQRQKTSFRVQYTLHFFLRSGTGKCCRLCWRVATPQASRKAQYRIDNLGCTQCWRVATPQASRKGWPYYIRWLRKAHDTFVYSRASPCGWPAAWRITATPCKNYPIGNMAQLCYTAQEQVHGEDAPHHRFIRQTLRYLYLSI